MKEATLDRRLKAAAEYVRQGAVFADIGTDHAYLPIYLLLRGVISFAHATDIAKGPLMRAKENAQSFSLQHKMEFHLTDGLIGLEERGITDIAVCGMGGEMIASIIDSSPFVRNEKIRLILQPMSKQERLRAYLYENGFYIIEERVGHVGSHTYSCICAEYDGKKREAEELSLYVGNPRVESEEEAREFLLLLDSKEKAFEKRLNGLLTSDKEADAEKELLSAIKEKKAEIYESFRII